MKITKKQVGTGVVIIAALYLFLRYFSNILSGVGLILSAASTLILGFIIAYVLNILMNFYENKLLKKMKFTKLKTLKRVCGILLSIISIVLIIVLLAWLVIPELKNCIDVLIASIPDFMNQLQKLLEQYPDVAAALPEELTTATSQSIDINVLIEKAYIWAISGMSGDISTTIISIVSSAVSSIVTFFMAFIFALYILGGKETLKRQSHRFLDTYMKPAHKEKMLYVLGTFNDSFHSFVVGQCIEAVILGTLCIIGMLILRLPYAVMIGALVGCTALIPVVGAYVGTIVGTIMIFTVSPIKALVFIIFLLTLQQIEGQLIYPRVVGTSIGLPGIWVFGTVIFGGALCGVPGILFGIPIVAGCYHLLQNDVRKKNVK